MGVAGAETPRILKIQVACIDTAWFGPEAGDGAIVHEDIWLNM